MEGRSFCAGLEANLNVESGSMGIWGCIVSRFQNVLQSSRLKQYHSVEYWDDMGCQFSFGNLYEKKAFMPHRAAC